MIIWERDGWRIYDNEQEIQDKYTGIPKRYRLQSIQGKQWRDVRRLDLEGITIMLEALAQDLSKR